MSIIEIIILALIQGFTEFLPISSSAHLILPSQILGWEDQGIAFDVALHVGTLFAVLLFFKTEIKTITAAWSHSIFKQQHTSESKLAWSIGVATIPVGLSGLFGKNIVETYLREPIVIAVTTILFGVLLGCASKISNNDTTEYNLTWKKIITIGLAQCLALIPGTSRSGITITAGLMVGLTKETAARYSFLLSIPVIVLAGGLETLKLIKLQTAVNWNVMLLGVFISFVTAYFCIKFFLQMVEKIGYAPFVVYRLILGVGLLFAF